MQISLKKPMCKECGFIDAISKTRRAPINLIASGSQQSPINIPSRDERTKCATVTTVKAPSLFGVKY
jgi:hypothetical protein